MVDRDGTILLANERMEKLFGYSPGELVGRSVELLVPDSLRIPDERASLFRTLATRITTGREMVGLRKDGTEIPVEVGYDTAETEGGFIALSTVVDLTERKRHLGELEARSAQQGAVAQLGLYGLSERDPARLIDRAATTCAQTLKVEFAEVLELQPGCRSFLLRAGVGWSPGLVGTATIPADHNSQGGFTLQARVPVVVEDFHREKRFAISSLLAAHGIVSGVTVIIQGRDGSYGVLGVQTRRRRTFGGNEVHFVQSVANLLATAMERERMETELRHSQQRLALAESEEKLRKAEHLAALGTLAAGIAHEVNNPLNSILMNAEYGVLTLERGGDPKVLPRLLHTIAEEAKRCGAITNRVLQFSKANRLVKESQDLNEILRRARDIAMTYFRKFRVVLKTELEEPLAPLLLDAPAMEQAIAHLLRNAAESGATEVWATTEPTSGGARLTVRDNGPGIPLDDRRRIFDPFFSSRRQQGGAGLGLSIVYRIVTDHGGSIDVRSRAGEGATFVVDLPRETPRGEHP